MRIQHNIAALNSHRQLTTNNSSVSKNLEKLSSGYRINRAGDDAAGLAISEKMRAQITGLNTASKNAQDGISLVQTAEGALTEVHSMLNRMTELADQSANGTYQDAVDRENLQKEMDSLRGEIDRISEGTNFNGIKLLDGSMSGATVRSKEGITTEATNGTFELDLSTFVPATGLTTGTAVSIGGISFTGTGAATDLNSVKTALTAANATATFGGVGYKVTIDGDKATFTSVNAGDTSAATTAIISAAVTVGGTAVAGLNVANHTDGAAETKTAATARLTFNKNPKVGETLEIGSERFQFVEAGSAAEAGFTAIEIGADIDLTMANIETALNTVADIDNVTFNAEKNSFSFESGGTSPDIAAKIDIKQNVQGLKLQIGDTAEDFNQLSVTVGSMSAEALELDGISVATQEGAKAAIDVIKSAINTVSSTRGDLGAIQNRLEHTVNNLGVTAENMTAAESRIRDVDMAQEMMAFTKNNILTQASQSMLAQANQLPQGVLQLLQ